MGKIEFIPAEESTKERELISLRREYESLSMYMLGMPPITVYPTVANRIGLLNAIFIQEYFTKNDHYKFRPKVNDSAVLSDEEWATCIKELKELELLGIYVDERETEVFGMNVPDIVSFLAEGEEEDEQ